MKKIIVCLFFVIMVAGLSVPVFAAQQLLFTVEPSKTTVIPGEEISFSVKVTGSECLSLAYVPEYDSSVLEMVEGKCTAQGTALAEFSRTEGGVLLFKKVTAPDGELFRFTMRVKDDAPTGEVTVAGIVAAKNGSATVPAKLIGARLTVPAEDSVGSDAPTGDKQPTQQTEDAAVPEETGSGDVSEQPGGTAAVPEQTESEDTSAQNGSTAPAESTGQDAVGKQPADPVPKTTFWWIPMAVVLVAVGAAVTVILLRKKKKV